MKKNKLKPLRIGKYIIKKILKVRKIKSGIDLGYLDGRHLILLPKNSIGVDISPKNTTMLRKLEYKIVISNLNNKLPFKNESFDLAIITHVLEHLQAPYFTLMEIYRILKPNGILIAAVPNFHRIYRDPSKKYYHLYSFSIKTFKDLIKKTNFKIISEFFNWQKIDLVYFGLFWNFLLKLFHIKNYLAPDIWIIAKKY